MKSSFFQGFTYVFLKLKRPQDFKKSQGLILISLIINFRLFQAVGLCPKTTVIIPTRQSFSNTKQICLVFYGNIQILSLKSPYSFALFNFLVSK